ncbi:MAG: TIM barrel protein [Chloroflexota bacterium]
MGSNIRIGNAPCSWGVVQGVDGGSDDWRRVLSEIAAAGYTGSELGDWGFMPNDPALLRDELASRKLAMIGAFTPLRLSDKNAHGDAEAVAVRTARLLAKITVDGQPFVILADDPSPATHRRERAGRIREEDGLDDEGWRALAAGAERIARAVRDETGLRTVFHHHCATYVETAEETARLMEMTSDALGLCLDTGHWYYAGGDPLEPLRAYRERTWLVHFKDCDGETAAFAKAEGWDYLTAIRNGIFCGLGEGAIDHAAIAAELKSSGYDGWIVAENEAPPGRMPALAMAQQDRAYFAGLGL